jgi:hypothetical protein
VRLHCQTSGLLVPSEEENGGGGGGDLITRSVTFSK